jgi:hypothetical protein
MSGPLAGVGLASLLLGVLLVGLRIALGRRTRRTRQA